MKKGKKFNEFMSKTIKELEDEKRYGTAHIYQSTLNAFSGFCKTPVIFFHQINCATLKQFETHLRNKQLSWNTVSTYMRTLRATYNKAADKRLVPANPRLFSNVYTGVKNETKRALEVEEMNKLLCAVPLEELPQELSLCRVWTNLMFQLRGMPFVDLIFLHKSDLKGNVISYRRQKTGTDMRVDVPPATMELIKEYRSTNPKSPYLFPILSGENEGEKLYGEYQRALRTFNYNLDRLAKKCGVTAKVSSYTTRHTWATLAKYCHFSEQLISEAFGHSSTKVTEGYMKSFKNDEIKRANDEIIFYVTTNGGKNKQSRKITVNQANTAPLLRK